jgi:hypothetical protein
MSRGGYFSLGALALLLALAGCGRGFWNMGERAAWRHDAEVACMKSGEVKLGAAVVQIEPIEGPGMCGADFPLKVSALGEANGMPMSYSDDIRPPASIPSGDMPRWPGGDPRYAPVQSAPSAPVQAVQTMRVNGETLRWMPGPQGIVRQADGAAPVGQPMSLDAPGVGPVMMPAAARRDDIPDDAILPDSGRGPATRPAYSTPSRQPPPQSRAVPPLGPMRGPAATTAMTMSAQLTPAATLSCPIVSALDRWVAQGVQPAALRWFGSPVATIKQIGSWSAAAANSFPSTPSAMPSTSPASRSPTAAASRSRTVGTARRRSRDSCTTSSFRPARCSRPCLRRATTSITTTIFTWT